MEEKFLEFVADVLGCDTADISMETRYREFEKWDSVAYLNLIMELEEEYDTTISIEMAGKVENLQDLYKLAVKEA